MKRMSEAEKKAWANVAKAANVKSNKHIDDVYTEWSKVYDDDVITTGYCTPDNLVGKMMKYVNNSPTSQILDIGAGTGKCGEVLKKQGFKGIIDALDINRAMLDVARSKFIYRGHYNIGVFPDKPIPLEYGLYDAVICAGTMMSGHMEPECVTPLVRALKPGGYALWNIRHTDHENEYKYRMEKTLDELVKEAEIEKIEEKLMQHCAVEFSVGNKLMAIIYVYRKL
uniref:uncharacterized protein LOC120331635 n=1 Tax=Styela clava TaxID=7725 RepID=UPI00193A3E48|nr:uncharacterized protein LOC120331635 [Styela clava]